MTKNSEPSSATMVSGAEASSSTNVSKKNSVGKKEMSPHQVTSSSMPTGNKPTTSTSTAPPPPAGTNSKNTSPTVNGASSSGTTNVSGAPASGAAVGPAAPPPQPPSHPYYSFPPHAAAHGIPSSYEAAGGPPPGPYTAAQYDARKSGLLAPSSHYGANGHPSSIPSGGSPPARDPPPHYAPPHLPSNSQVPGVSERRYYLALGEDHRAGPPHHRATSWGETSYRGFYDRSRPPPPPSQYPPPPPPPQSSSHLEVGPYRFSDPTLRREAVNQYRHTASSSVTNPNAERVERVNEVDGREGATSPSQIETMHKEEVTTMGCTCKKTQCLKLYCQCFAVKIYCGGNCRCMICKNTTKFDAERKDAIRNILSRNPSAFDTKFKKSAPEITDISLAHKLGCKCRKSACMKKYCECYAGSVKCSSNCRCVGCKNMPRGGLSGDDSGPTGLGVGTVHSGSDEEASPTKSRTVSNAVATTPTQSKGTGKKQEWNAAQNLAFLKHASPVAEKPRRTHSSDNEGGSMPSLASEESPSLERKTGNGMKTVSVGGASAMPEPTSSEKSAVNALLMAAMAMTEMSGQNTAVPAAATSDSKMLLSTPPAANTISVPHQHSPPQAMDTRYDTPQKNLLGQFNNKGTPKRKKLETNGETSEAQKKIPALSGVSQSPVKGNSDDDALGPMRRTGEEKKSGSPSSSYSASGSDDESPKREHPGDETPSNQQQKVKRSRIGSLKKGCRNLGEEMAKDHPTTNHPSLNGNKKSNSMILETPKTKGDGKKNELTPVSARCIDFRKMHVNEASKSNPAETN